MHVDTDHKKGGGGEGSFLAVGELVHTREGILDDKARQFEKMFLPGGMKWEGGVKSPWVKLTMHVKPLFGFSPVGRIESLFGMREDNCCLCHGWKRT